MKKAKILFCATLLLAFSILFASLSSFASISIVQSDVYSKAGTVQTTGGSNVSAYSIDLSVNRTQHRLYYDLENDPPASINVDVGITICYFDIPSAMNTPEARQWYVQMCLESTPSIMGASDSRYAVTAAVAGYIAVGTDCYYYYEIENNSQYGNELCTASDTGLIKMCGNYDAVQYEIYD